MARKKTPDNPAPPKNDAKAERSAQRSRAILLGAIAAGGAFQLNGWQAQAHGNRSSHSAAALRSNLFMPSDYLSFRGELLAPNSVENTVLSRMRSEIATLSSGAGGNRLKSLEVQSERLQNQLALRSVSRKALVQLRANNMDAAIAAIEGNGQPERVTYEYLWTLTDLAHLNRQGNSLTDENLPEIEALGAAAVAYNDKLLEYIDHKNLTPFDTALLARMAEIYHNVSAYVIPDIGEPTDNGLRLGYKAVRSALEIRKMLKQPSETQIGTLAVGRYEARLGNKDAARQLYESSLQQAQKLGDAAQVAWSKFSLSQLEPVRSSRKMLREVDSLIQGLDDSDPAVGLLKLELSKY